MRGFLFVMKFSIVVSAHPHSAVSESALHFCREVIEQGFSIERIFYLGQGTLNACIEYELSLKWQQFIVLHSIDAVCCTASAIEDKLANELGKSTSRLNQSFHIAGLGQLIEMHANADRVVTFGDKLCLIEQDKATSGK